MEHTKHCKITSEVRDAAVRLNLAGLKNSEIADILNVSSSSVAYTIQCYKAAESDDWDTLRRLASTQGQNVKWALDKFGKTLPADAVDEQSVAPCQPVPTFAYARTDERFDEIQKSLNGIGFILSEILAELRG